MFPLKKSLIGITQGLNQPSSRFRWRQFVDSFENNGFNVLECPSGFGAYAPAMKSLRPAWVCASLVQNFMRVMRSNRYDIRFLQRELTATLATWEFLLKPPFIFDVDDAIFLGKRGFNADKIAGYASLTICGNSFLAEHFGNFSDVVVVPTAVDHHKFCPGQNHLSTSRPIIGWSGSSSGLQYLYMIESAILEVLNRFPDVVLKVVSDKEPRFRGLPKERIVYEKWHPNIEADALKEFTIGIMPLENNLWSRGKCSFKMLTYMATGIPVVVSPFGMNGEVLNASSCGFGAISKDDWVDALTCLLVSPSLRQRMGEAGRLTVLEKYSKDVVADTLTEIILSQVA
jgi:glycosyltransferase involved in cell wall biosynthesis